MNLSDLLKSARAERGRTLEEISLDQILPNPSQPRRSFDESGIEELARSIESVGLIQPIVVRKNGRGYELISGERRLRALQKLGRTKAACIVDRHTGSEESALMAVIENLQREDLDFFEEAECYKTLLDAVPLTQEGLAERIGKSQSFIANKLRLLRIEPRTRAVIRRFSLSERHARALLKLDDPGAMLEAAQKAGEGRLSVTETERLTERMLNERFDKRKDGAKPRPVVMRLVRDYRIFVNTISSACDQLRSGGVGVEMEKNEFENGVDMIIRVRGIGR